MAEAADEPPVAEIADSAPQLIDINSVSVITAPVGAYVVPEDADAILKVFLSEVNDVARDSEVVRCEPADSLLKRLPVTLAC